MFIPNSDPCLSKSSASPQWTTSSSSEDDSTVPDISLETSTPRNWSLKWSHVEERRACATNQYPMDLFKEEYPSIVLSTSKVRRNQTFSMTLVLTTLQASVISDDQIRNAGLAATCRKASRPEEVIRTCFCCRGRAPISYGVSCRAAFGPHPDPDGRHVNFVFDQCNSWCTSSNEHLGGQVIIAIDLLPGFPSIVSAPFSLYSRPRAPRHSEGTGKRTPAISAGASYHSNGDSSDNSPMVVPQVIQSDRVVTPSPLLSSSKIFTGLSPLGPKGRWMQVTVYRTCMNEECMRSALETQLTEDYLLSLNHPAFGLYIALVVPSSNTDDIQTPLPKEMSLPNVERLACYLSQ